MKVLAVVLFVTLAYAQDVSIPTPLTKNLGDYYVSVGVISIEEMKKVFPRAFNLLKRYHGEPSSDKTHHIAVSIWKDEKGQTVYISDFKVEAEVRSPLLRALRINLNKYPHQYGDNYGGWFNMSEKGLYHIAIIIHEDNRVRRVSFDYLIR